MDAPLSWSRDRDFQVPEKPDQFENTCREAWLLGQPPLEDYLQFVEEMTTGGTPLRSKLVDEWRAAKEYYGELEKKEAGIADNVEIVDLDHAMRPLARDVAADNRFLRACDTLPTRIAMVELERLIVGQSHVNVDHTDRLAARLADTTTSEALFRFCLPLDRAEAPVQMRKMDSSKFMLWSASSDFRFQEAALLRPDQVARIEPLGPVGGIIGLMTGYGSNFLSVIESDGRLVLHNGHHRAYALVERGFTHAPAVIQTVTRMDELKLAAGRRVLADPAFYFKSARPPLLKDFFDPIICKVLQVPKFISVVEISFEVNEYRVKDFASGA